MVGGGFNPLTTDDVYSCRENSAGDRFCISRKGGGRREVGRFTRKVKMA